jgi:hypothetical protein
MYSKMNLEGRPSWRIARHEMRHAGALHSVCQGVRCALCHAVLRSLHGDPFRTNSEVQARAHEQHQQERNPSTYATHLILVGKPSNWETKAVHLGTRTMRTSWDLGLGGLLPSCRQPRM